MKTITITIQEDDSGMTIFYQSDLKEKATPAEKRAAEGISTYLDQKLEPVCAYSGGGNTPKEAMKAFGLQRDIWKAGQ